MRKFILFVFVAMLAALASPALAGERLFQRDGAEVRIMDTPCMHPLVLAYAAGIVPATDLRKAYGVIRGQRFDACWRAVDGGVVHIIWEDGDQDTLLNTEFMESPSASLHDGAANRIDEGLGRCQLVGAVIVRGSTTSLSNPEPRRGVGTWSCPSAHRIF